MQVDILDRGPDNGETTGLGREGTNRIGALAHIVEETLNGIGALNVPMHLGREIIKRQRFPFLLRQASHSLWIALTIFGFEGH